MCQVCVMMGLLSPEEYTAADALLDLAESVYDPPGQLILVTPAVRARMRISMETSIARIALALDFDKRPAGFKLRALVEGWDVQTLVREMY